jgi:hypothetical protein
VIRNLAAVDGDGFTVRRLSWLKATTTPLGWSAMSKKTKKRKARMRRSKANHGKRPNMGRG